jgi:hypothetical protein
VAEDLAQPNNAALMPIIRPAVSTSGPP